MSKKQLNTDLISNELSGGASLFFRNPKPSKKVTKDKKQRVKPVKDRKTTDRDIMTSRNHAITKSINHDVKQSSNHDVTIEEIRKAVRQVGKDLTSLRLTPEETRALRDVAYAYESQGYKTSRNEIARIGINYLLNDYRENGRNSILEQVINALTS